MKRDLNLESWKVFAAVARTGSITETSAELEMDAPSISRIVSGLEKSLGGISLFDRSLLPLTLTDNGRFALEYATKMITLHDQLVTGLAANTDAMSGVLRVGVPPALLQGFLMPFFVSFGRRYPEIQLEVSEYLGGIPIDFSYPAGSLDVVMSYGPDPTHSNFVQIRYGDAGFICCASPTYIARYGMPKTPEDLADHVGIRFKSPLRLGTVGQQLMRGSEHRAVRFKRDIVFSSALSAKSATLIGAGIAPDLGDLHCYRELAKGELIPVLRDWSYPRQACYIYTRPDLVKLKRVRTFIDEYRANVEPLLAECAEVIRNVME